MTPAGDVDLCTPTRRYDRWMPSEEPGVVWSLQGFSKVDEFLRTEFPISRDQILRLREVIEPDADDPWMFLCYAVPVELWPSGGRDPAMWSA